MPRTALLAGLFLLVLPSAAEARSLGVRGQVIAQPGVARGKVRVPVLLNERAERRLRLGGRVVRLILPKTSAPKPDGGGRITIPATAIRSGDTLSGRVKLPRRARRLARKRGPISLRGARMRVVRRESAYSTDELTVSVLALARELVGVYARLDSLDRALESVRSRLAALESTTGGVQSGDSQSGDSQSGDLAALESQVDELTGEMDSLQTSLAGVQSSLAELTADVATLQDGPGTSQGQEPAPQEEVTALQGQVTALQGQVTSLDDHASTLESQVASVQNTLNAICAMELIVVC
jgi:prefoldin subunit 5